MVSLAQVLSHLASGPSDLEYQSRVNLNLYNSPSLDRLSTQILSGRHLRISSLAQNQTESKPALNVCLCEDDYSGWLAIADLNFLEEAAVPYRAIARSRAEIKARLPAVLAFARAAQAQPNYYLWGGTVGPNYDCSGLVQHAFSSLGIWLPRDSYQQEAFTQPVLISRSNPADLSLLAPGDLIFFGSPQRTNHVGIHLGEGYYIHSSGKDQGRNGIGINQLSLQGDLVSQTYYQQLRGAGRVVASYQPQTFN